MLTAQKNLRVGLFSLELVMNDDLTSEILNIGDLEIDLDVTPDSAEMDAVRSEFGSIDIELPLYSKEGVDLYEAIQAAIVDSAPDYEVKCRLIVTTHEGKPLPTVFFLEDGDIDVDDFKQTISIRLEPKVDEDLRVVDVMDELGPMGITFSQETEGGVSRSYRAYHAIDFIEKALEMLFRNEGEGLDFRYVAPPGFTKMYDSDQNGDAFVIVKPFDSPDPGAPNLVSDIEIESGNGAIWFDANSLNVEGGPWERILSEPSPGAPAASVLRPGYEGANFTADMIGRELITLYNNRTVGIIDSVNGNDVVLTSPTTVGLSTRYGYKQPTRWGTKTQYNPRELKAADLLLSLAAGTGSFFGSFFGVNYFINRAGNESVSDRFATLDDFSDLKYKRRAQYVNGIFFTQVSTVFDYDENGEGTLRVGASNFGVLEPNNLKMPNLQISRAYTIKNPNAERDLVIDLAVGYPFLNKAVIDGVLAKGLGLGGENVTLENNLVENAVRSYARALSEPKSIKGTFTSADPIMPWESLILQGPGIPDKYRMRRWRPTKLKYSFVKDELEADLYFLGSIVSDDPPQDFPPIEVVLPEDPALPSIDLVRPARSATGVNELTPFEWTSEPDYAEYEWQIFDSYRPFNRVFSMTTANSVEAILDPDALEPEKFYYWNVRGITSGGDAGPWSGLGWFVSQAADDPGDEPVPVPTPNEVKNIRTFAAQNPKGGITYHSPSVRASVADGSFNRKMIGRIQDQNVGGKTLSRIFRPDGVVRKVVEVEEEGPDNSLSKRIRTTAADGRLKSLEMVVPDYVQVSGTESVDPNAPVLGMIGTNDASISLNSGTEGQRVTVINLTNRELAVVGVGLTADLKFRGSASLIYLSAKQGFVAGWYIENSTGAII